MALGGSRPPGLDDLLPEGVVSSTARAACRFASSRTILDGPAAILTQGVLGAMAMTRWWKVACLLVVAGATVSGAGILAGRGSHAVEAGSQDPGRQPADMPVAAATRGPFRLVVADPGTLEPSQMEDLISHVSIATEIASLVPDGNRVKKGDVVCELDSEVLRNQLINQRIATMGAEASFQNAKLTREVAELAVKEYEEGVFAADRATMQGEIGLAKMGLEKATDRLKRLHQWQAKLNNAIGPQDKPTAADILAQVDFHDRIDSAEQAAAREKLAIAKVQSKLHTLETYTRPKVLRELTSEIEKALSNELAKKQIYQLEKDKESKLEKQIAASKLVAPFDGLVVLADSDRLPGQRHPVPIKQGATVRRTSARRPDHEPRCPDAVQRPRRRAAGRPAGGRAEGHGADRRVPRRDLHRHRDVHRPEAG